ncbi:hypothetical protein BGW36DRAFT_429840 [Talaromyces proteolyticus]|uniref:Uncharacterized protein n=1 Tax=Talaromyces proteolyticus TaxID=1131652 RepID=A0AAD4KKX3_9EURO|nr:uncharacterized protein BGW36DRAFT_429840 [Talaromyces proteolyticus]KAH8693808.1 hypothetical protein BGW36DRAFT_429840 [Talaromyces proteolyticus]
MSATVNCEIILLSLTSVSSFSDILAKSDVKPLTTAKVARWIIPPTVLSVDALTQTEWDLVLCSPLPVSIPDECRPFIQRSWSATFAAPAELVSSYTSIFTSLASNIPARTKHMDQVTGSDEGTSLSTESMHVPIELRNWMTTFSDTNNHPPVIMLNLMAFKDVQKYGGYREALSRGVGKRHGLKPLLFGQVTKCSSITLEGGPEWDLVGLIYYPSVLHFADMLADEEYQEIRRKYRLGLAVAEILASEHGYHVIIGSRNAEAGQQAAASICKERHSASSVQLDLNSESSINAAIQTIEQEFGFLDILVNNAAVFSDVIPWIDRPTLGAYELFSTTFATNVVGTAVLTEGLLPLLRKGQAKPGRIVFVTGRLASMAYAIEDKKRFPDWKAYSASKAAVNMLTLRYAEQLEDDGIKVNAVDPGLVDTDLSGHIEGAYPPEIGAISTVRMATLGEDGATATFTDRDGPLPW